MNGVTYDGAGNQTVIGADTLTYNPENQVTQVTETPAAGGRGVGGEYGELRMWPGACAMAADELESRTLVVTRFRVRG